MSPRNGLMPTTDERFPVRFGDDGFPLCRKCGKRMDHKLRRWCSEKCRESICETNPGWMRSAVRRRDRGICSKCGWDTQKWHNIANAMRRFCFYDPRESYETWKWFYLEFGLEGYESRSLWEADHIVPLIEGGGLGIDNMRTLCVPCHKTETAELARRRAVARSNQKVLQF
jgi:5-methylcytosine-specific restriction protein A